MTVYQIRKSWEDGEPHTEVDPEPVGVTEVWEVAGGQRWWRHPGKPGVWVPDGEEDPLELLWPELLHDFYAVTDNQHEVASMGGCPVCGPTGCAGHTRAEVSA